MRMTSKGIFLEGFNGPIGVSDVDQNDVIFGSVSNVNSRFNEKVKALHKNQALKKKKHLQLKKNHAEILQIKKDVKQEKQMQRDAFVKSRLEKSKNRKFLAGIVQAPMGYDFTNFTGDPNAGNFGNEGLFVDSHNLIGESSFEDIETVDGFNNMLGGGFGKGIKLGKVKISAPKIAAPKIKIAAPKIKIAAPKIKIAAPKIKIPTLKKIGQDTSKNLKAAVKATGNVVAAPIAAGAHVLKQAGGHKLESGLKAATGISVTEMARGGQATLTQAGKTAGAVMSAPTLLADKVVRQVGGHKLVEGLDRATGGTYSQAVRVGTLPGRAVAGEAIKKSDWIDAISFAAKVAAVVGAGSIIGYAIEVGKKKAMEQLALKMGAASGALFALVNAYASGGDIEEAALKVGTDESKKAALAEATKKLGPEAANILSIGSATYSGGAGAAADVGKGIVVDKAKAAVASKMGVPLGIVSQIQSGKVPSVSDVKESMKRELLAAPEKLKSELAKIPEQIKNAPEAAKAALRQKQALITDEIKNRDKTVSDLLTKHGEALKKADFNIKDQLAKVDLQKELTDKANANYIKVKSDPKASADDIAAAQKTAEVESVKVAEMDSALAVAVADKETMDNVFEAKQVSASNGMYGVRTADSGAVLAEYKEVLPQSKVDQSLSYEHPFISAGLIPRPAAQAARI